MDKRRVIPEEPAQIIPILRTHQGPRYQQRLNKIIHDKLRLYRALFGFADGQREHPQREGQKKSRISQLIGHSSCRNHQRIDWRQAQQAVCPDARRKAHTKLKQFLPEDDEEQAGYRPARPHHRQHGQRR